jgi:hypothetical protein
MNKEFGNMLILDKITEIFCIVDDFCKEYAPEVKKHQTLPSHGKNIKRHSIYTFENQNDYL